MAYQDIDNLYKNQTILLFRECYALEKIHGTSAHVRWHDEHLAFFSGGIASAQFTALFDVVSLTRGFEELGLPDVTVYGEAYGGKCQGMSAVYGPALQFAVFEVRVGRSWLSVPNAEDVAGKLGLEFVPYRRVPTDFFILDAERDSPSVQAERNGMGWYHNREGIVLRPLVEVTLNDGGRVIAKHKSEAYAERKHPPRVLDPALLEVLTDADRISDEWVTPMRLAHVLDGLPRPHGIEQTGDVVKATVADVLREAAGEIVESKDVRKAVGRAAAREFKSWLAEDMRNLLAKGAENEVPQEAGRD